MRHSAGRRFIHVCMDVVPSCMWILTGRHVLRLLNIKSQPWEKATSNRCADCYCNNWFDHSRSGIVLPLRGSTTLLFSCRFQKKLLSHTTWYVSAPRLSRKRIMALGACDSLVRPRSMIGLDPFCRMSSFSTIWEPGEPRGWLPHPSSFVKQLRTIPCEKGLGLSSVARVTRLGCACLGRFVRFVRFDGHDGPIIQPATASATARYNTIASSKLC